MMMNGIATTHESKKLIKTYKIVLPRKRIVVAMVCGQTYSKNDKKRWSRKTATNIKFQPHNLKGNAERERVKIVCYSRRRIVCMPAQKVLAH